MGCDHTAHDRLEKSEHQGQRCEPHHRVTHSSASDGSGVQGRRNGSENNGNVSNILKGKAYPISVASMIDVILSYHINVTREQICYKHYHSQNGWKQINQKTAFFIIIYMENNIEDRKQLRTDNGGQENTQEHKYMI
jgi:hypothetical protein